MASERTRVVRQLMSEGRWSEARGEALQELSDIEGEEGLVSMALLPALLLVAEVESKSTVWNAACLGETLALLRARSIVLAMDPQSPWREKISDRLGHALHARGLPDLALELLAESRSRRLAKGAPQWQIVDSTLGLADALLSAERYSEALEMFAWAGDAANGRLDAIDTISTHLGVGRAQLALGRHELARESFERAIAAYTSTFGERGRRLSELMEWLHRAEAPDSPR